MSTQQVAKIRLAPFNTAEYGEYMDGMTFPRTYYSGAVDNAAGYAAGVSTLVADGDFVGESPTGYIIYFAGHNAHYRIESTSIAGVLKLNLNLDKPLEKAVVDNEVITICRWYDITDCAIDVSDLEQEIEVNQNELVLDKQIRFRLFNFDDTFYDRTTFTSAWDNVSAYFTTRNTQNASDNKYVGIWVYNQTAAAYQQFYAGQIVRDEVQINEPQAEIRFMAESVFYGLNDITVAEVDGIFDGHKYTSSTRPTKTISGRYIDIIVKMFHAVGIPKITHDVTSREKNSGQCKIGFATDPEIISGEYIEIPDSMGIDYAGGHICDGVETISGTYYVYYHFGTNTVAVDNSDISGGCIAHRVFFNDLSEYIESTHRDWTFNLGDLWFICQKWRKYEIENETAINLFNDFCKSFCAFGNISFIGGKVYGKFVSKNNASGIKLTLNQDDFISKADIVGNWRFKSPNGVMVSTDVNYYNGGSYRLSENYNETLYGIVDGETTLDTTNYTDGLDKGNQNLTVLDDLNNLGSTDFSSLDGEKIKFSNHDTAYKMDADATQITLSEYRKLQSAVQNKSTFFLSTNDDLTLLYGDCFNLKTKRPEVYVASASTGAGAGKSFLRLTNYSDDVTAWDVEILNSDHDFLSVCGVQFLPPFKDDKSVSFHPLGFQLFTRTNSSIMRGYGIYTNDQARDNSILTTTINFGHVSAGYFTGRFDSETSTLSHRLYLIYSDGSHGEDLEKIEIILEDSGDSFERSDPPSTSDKPGKFGFWSYSAGTSKKMVNTSVLTGSWSGIFVNTSVLNPDFDDYIYFSWEDSTSPPLGGSLKRIKKIPIGDTWDTVSSLDAVTTGVGMSTDTYGLMIDAGDTYRKIWWVRYGYNDSVSSEIHTLDTDDAADEAVAIGGGATPSATLGNYVSGLTSIQLEEDTRGVWKTYDDYVFITEVGSNKVLLADLNNDRVYTICDSTDIDEPSQVFAFDFINTFLPFTGKNYHMSLCYLSSKKHFEYYSKDRRIVRGSLRWEDLDYLDIGIGDRVALDTTVVANNTYNQTVFWITRVAFNFETQEYDLEFLEDTDADQGIGSMIIGQDFVIS